MQLKKLVDKLQDDGHIDFMAFDYAEPGYSLGEGRSTILFGDWNGVDHRVRDILERRYELEWSDEWQTCDHCQGAVRTSPTSYDWQQHFVILSHDVVCLKCLSKELSWQVEYLEYIKNAAKSCSLLTDDQMVNLGWSLYNQDSFQTGFHTGMNDDPAKILREVREKHPNYDFVFGSLDKSQFYVEYKLWWIPVVCDECGEPKDGTCKCKENEND